MFWVLLCMVHLTVWYCHVTYAFRTKSTLYSSPNVEESLARSSREVWNLSDCNYTRSQNHLVGNPTMNYLDTLAKWLNCVLRNYLYDAFDCVFLTCHVHAYAFESESTPYSCLIVNEPLSQSRRKIWRLSDSKWTRTQNLLVHKWTLNHLAKLAKRLSYVRSTDLYGGFDCILLSCHVHFSDWTHTL